MKEKFNLFERRAVERCYCSSKVVPLVSFLCTTTTIISIAKLPAQSAEASTSAAAAAPSTVTKFAGVTQDKATAGTAGATKTAATVAAATSAPAASERIRMAAPATAAKQPSSKQTLSDDRALYQFYQKLIACPEVVCGRAISIEPFLQ